MANKAHPLILRKHSSLQGTLLIWTVEL